LNNTLYQPFAIATQSGKGKASLAMTARLNQNQGFAFQSLEVRHQLLKFDQFRKISVPFFAKNDCVRFCVLQTLEANIKS
jgi:hypothetical protein